MRVVLVQPPRWSPDGHENFDTVEEILAGFRTEAEDVVLLPELVGADLPGREYLARVRGLAARLGACVVGGSHYEPTPEGKVNRGVVVEAGAGVVLEYDKLNPYGVERRRGVLPGRGEGVFEVYGRRFHVLLCADLWYSELLARSEATDVVLVPAFSVTQWPTPDPARALWQHMCVARAYEFTAYVAVSDWHHASTYDGQPCAGVTGFADPYPARPGGYFTARPGHPVSAHRLDFDRLDSFRLNRAQRGFNARPTG
ncbi:carbon-nitrogen hydrolase family protein [Nonomuraea sp. NPDC000554]|uniref:carbon-nitrogen hydrolase family protein n=1 Tax=Nonomuraea sp. NPDC000554 TaxID=3154259 RepID=UPI00331A9ABF